MACFSRLPSAFLRAWDRHRSQSFSAGHSCRIRVITHAADLAPRTLSSCASSLAVCLHVDVPLQLFTFCATLLPPPFPVVRNAVRLMVHVPPDFSMHLWKVMDSNHRCRQVTAIAVLLSSNSANLPCPVCRDTIAAASYHHTSRPGYSSLSEIGHRPTVCHASHH